MRPVAVPAHGACGSVREVHVSSRSLAEYRAMFDLTERELEGTIVDCAAGASSFVAEVDAAGGHAFAFDPVYGTDRSGHDGLVREGAHHNQSLIDRHGDRFVWDWYDGSPAKRNAMRAEAGRRFVRHIRRRPQAYVAAALPLLPLRNRSVDLALCSHLLFTWATDFGQDWHLRAVLEMTRIAREARVFPLVLQGSGEPVGFLESLRADLWAAGVRTSVRQVPYEFQRGADRMLVASRKVPPW